MGQVHVKNSKELPQRTSLLWDFPGRRRSAGSGAGRRDAWVVDGNNYRKNKNLKMVKTCFMRDIFATKRGEGGSAVPL